jgi:hypothetical protein
MLSVALSARDVEWTAKTILAAKNIAQPPAMAARLVALREHDFVSLMIPTA